MSFENVRTALGTLRSELLAALTSDGHWEGELSASAVSTATAVSALSLVLRERSAAETQVELRSLIHRGVAWLLPQANQDGGFGDTDRSYSNVATTMLVRAALELASPHVDEADREKIESVAAGARQYWDACGGLEALRARYGADKTFVIPILTNAALAGLVSWKEVQALPFELAAVPQRMYRMVRMPVVSYAIPALVAMGQAHYHHVPPRNPLLRGLRKASIGRTLRVLRAMQPESGGYLEATPLTAFVLMSLASIGLGEHAVARSAVRFLSDSIRADGAWPIDTNLATWITSLSIHALTVSGSGHSNSGGADSVGGSGSSGVAGAADVGTDGQMNERECRGSLESATEDWMEPRLLSWLLGCQHRVRHPFTGADPGGWGWTDLSGAVPDGDDTPAAIIALADCWELGKVPEAMRGEVTGAVESGVGWLLRLQNRDGGWPTFCRGWGKLPFDRSSTDLTAHALRALGAAQATIGIGPERFTGWQRAVERGWVYLLKSQRSDGSMLPLWFGNQDETDDENPVYGTARMLVTAGLLGEMRAAEQRELRNRVWHLLRRGERWLVDAQREDGGWGGGVSRGRWLRERSVGRRLNDERLDGGVVACSSLEETAQALEGLSSWYEVAERLSRLAGSGLLEAEDAPEAAGWDWGTDPEWDEIRRNWRTSGEPACRAAIIRGLGFVCEAVRRAEHQDPWPIGFYFAKLWYHEKLYPTVFATAALGAAHRALSSGAKADVVPY